MIVEGQLHGGIVQGVGQALFENCVYDDDSGQLLSGSFMDYSMPRADNLPNMTIETHSTLCTHNPLGVKGCGEVGTIGSPATVINAVVDALSHLGVTHVDMPATPNRIWRVIQNAAMPQRRRVGGGEDEVICISQADHALRKLSALLGGVADSAPLAGGMTLLPTMKLRLAAPAALDRSGGIPQLPASRSRAIS